MATPFDPLLYANTITWIKVTPETIDPETGIPDPESTTTQSITGVIHETLPVQKAGVQYQTWSSLGELVAGYRSIHTETALTIGDRLEITERDNTITLWKIESLLSTYPTLTKILGISWYSYAIKLVDPSEQGTTPDTYPDIDDIEDIAASATFDPTTNHWTIISGAVTTSDSKSLVNQETDSDGTTYPDIEDWN